MQRHSVDSSMIDSIGYDLDSQKLQVEFNDGSIYDYFPVPKWVPLALMMAPSVGQAFWQLIRGNSEYTYIKVEE